MNRNKNDTQLINQINHSVKDKIDRDINRHDTLNSNDVLLLTI